MYKNHQIVQAVQLLRFANVKKIRNVKTTATLLSKRIKKDPLKKRGGGEYSRNGFGNIPWVLP